MFLHMGVACEISKNINFLISFLVILYVCVRNESNPCKKVHSHWSDYESLTKGLSGPYVS